MCQHFITKIVSSYRQVGAGTDNTDTLYWIYIFNHNASICKLFKIENLILTAFDTDLIRNVDADFTIITISSSMFNTIRVSRIIELQQYPCIIYKPYGIVVK